jgi:hypothetical protein
VVEDQEDAVLLGHTMVLVAEELASLLKDGWMYLQLQSVQQFQL